MHQGARAKPLVWHTVTSTGNSAETKHCLGPRLGYELIPVSVVLSSLQLTMLKVEGFVQDSNEGFRKTGFS